MDSEATILLTPALTLCVALIGPGMVFIEDTRATQRRRPQETGEIVQHD